jgi:hypothetical protein
MVKCILVQSLRLCTGCTAHTGSRGIALPFHDHGTRRGWGVSVMPWPLFTARRDPVPIVQEAGWAPGPVRTGAENLAPTGIWFPDRPARSQSLYRLSYPAHKLHMIYTKICITKQKNEPHPLIMPITRHVSEITGSNRLRTCWNDSKLGM